MADFCHCLRRRFHKDIVSTQTRLRSMPLLETGQEYNACLFCCVTTTLMQKRTTASSRSNTVKQTSHGREFFPAQEQYP